MSCRGSGKGAFTEWKGHCSTALILEFLAREMRKVRAIELNFPAPKPFPKPGKVQTRPFRSFQPAKSSKRARLNFPSAQALPRA